MRAREVVAVHAGHADVEERELGAEVARRPRSASAPLVGDAHVVAQRAQQRGEAVGEVDVVVDEQDAMGVAARAARASRRGAACDPQRGRASGRRTMNSLPWPRPSLRASSRAAVQLDQAARERQARRPGPRCVRSSERSACANISKICGSTVGGDADAVVRAP